MALKTLAEGGDLAGARVDIVSGSATWEGNKALLEDAGPSVSFRATVLPDSFARETLLHYIRDLLPHGNDETIAVLVESNTSYGIGLRNDSQEDERQTADTAHGHVEPDSDPPLPAAHLTTAE